MARTFKGAGLGMRMANAVVRFMATRGWGPVRLHVLTIKGRRTGQAHSIPVGVMEVDRRRYLVAAYGITNWVRNIRVAGEATLNRGGRTERYGATEVGRDEAGPVLRKYLRDVRVVRPYFDITVDASDEEFAAEAKTHPVFRLDPLSS